MIPSCTPAWARVLRAACFNGRLLPGFHIFQMGLWPSRLASGRAGSVSSWAYDADGNHILTCCRHLATRIRGHNHIQDCPVS